jgi:hypothetical protein
MGKKNLILQEPQWQQEIAECEADVSKPGLRQE